MKLNAAMKFIVCLAVTFAVATIGSFFTRQGLTDWYANLNKPIFNPPGWLFGPVWTVLYFLMAASVFLVWQKGIENPWVKTAIVLYLIQLILNGLWTPIFFGLRMPLAAFCEIVLLLAAIVLTMWAFAKVSRAAALLLVGYIAWTTFAAVLNFSIWMLNK